MFRQFCVNDKYRSNYTVISALRGLGVGGGGDIHSTDPHPAKQFQAMYTRKCACKAVLYLGQDIEYLIVTKLNRGVAWLYLSTLYLIGLVSRRPKRKSKDRRPNI